MIAVSTLRIRDYVARVHLGVLEHERETAQTVLFNVRFDFNQNVHGEKSDSLEDTVDYVRIITIIKEVSSSQKFLLIEHLGFSVAKEIKEFLQPAWPGHLEVSALKQRVPVDNLQTGVEWICRMAW